MNSEPFDNFQVAKRWKILNSLPIDQKMFPLETDSIASIENHLLISIQISFIVRMRINHRNNFSEWRDSRRSHDIRPNLLIAFKDVHKTTYNPWQCPQSSSSSCLLMTNDNIVSIGAFACD